MYCTLCSLKVPINILQYRCATLIISQYSSGSWTSGPLYDIDFTRIIVYPCMWQRDNSNHNLVFLSQYQLLLVHYRLLILIWILIRPLRYHRYFNCIDVTRHTSGCHSNQEQTDNTASFWRGGVSGIDCWYIPNNRDMIIIIIFI